MAGADSESGEDRLIGRFFRPLATDPRALSLIDDVALMRPPSGCDLVLKTDAIVGGVHFLPDDPADTVARKALRVNLSDLAAKGAAPSGYLLTLALPEGVPDAWLSEFARGLKEDAETFACPLLGGDTVRTSGPIVVSVAAIGILPSGSMVGRTGARAGDHVVVTGAIGDAVLGLHAQRDEARAVRWGLDRAMREYLVNRYRVPQPRNALAEAIRACANASMDVSDGLAGDLGKLCRASGVGALIEVERVPASPAGRAVLAADPSLRKGMLTGGDDYEIVCTVPEDRLDRFLKMAGAARVDVAAIGRVAEKAAGVRFVDRDGAPLVFARPSFSHF